MSTIDLSSISTGLDTPNLLDLFRQMVLLRRFEERVKILYKDGELPGFIHLYIGQEATGVGVMAHLRQEDWITSTHRGHGHALAKGVPPKLVLAELAGKATGVCGGRGGTMHLYAPEYGLFGTNGIVAGGLPASVGLGMSAKVRGTDNVAVSFFGDGAVNHGSFHESVNFAGIQNAPVVFVCENNLYATCISFDKTTRNADVADKAVAYGVPGIQVDGNDVLAVWQATLHAVNRARAGEGPTLIEAKTYRMVGHHEGDPLVGTYRDEAEMDAWAKRCPILRMKQLLVSKKIATDDELEALDTEILAEIEEAVEFARSSPQPDPATVYQHTWANPINPAVAEESRDDDQKPMRVQSWLNAVRDAIAEEMRNDSGIMYLGEGIGERGGTFAHTKGLYKEFGADRVVDTPICELGFTGASIGASATGCRTIADLMITDFLFEADSQIFLQAARLRYMSNGQLSVPMIVRSGMGTVKNTGPHHSGTYYPIWSHCPGLIVAVPSTPADAKGMMKTALRASDPVIFLEQKSLLSTKGPVPEGEHFVPFGKAKVLQSGDDLTIVSCGLWLQTSLKAAQTLAAEGISCEVIDLRTIVPLDVETIVESVTKTGRILVVDEAYAMCGLGGEIAATLMEHAFDELDAPVGRLHTAPVPHPFSPSLENEIVATPERIVAAAKAVMEGRPQVPLRAMGPSRRSAAASKATAVDISDDSNGRSSVESAILPVNKEPAEASSCVDGVPLIMPNMDLTITEATVVLWLKQVGDTIEEGQAVAEIETDKAVSEIESPVSGTLVEIVVEEGAVVALGERIGTIRPN